MTQTREKCLCRAFTLKRNEKMLILSLHPAASVNCKLLTFPDTGRCKGQAYLTFETDADAKKAISLSGTTIENNIGDDNKKNPKKKEVTRKELKLKVTKMLNRSATKKKMGSP